MTIRRGDTNALFECGTQPVSSAVGESVKPWYRQSCEVNSMSTKRELFWSLTVVFALLAIWVALILSDYVRRPL